MRARRSIAVLAALAAVVVHAPARAQLAAPAGQQQPGLLNNFDGLNWTTPFSSGVTFTPTNVPFEKARARATLNRLDSSDLTGGDIGEVRNSVFVAPGGSLTARNIVITAPTPVRRGTVDATSSGRPARVAPPAQSPGSPPSPTAQREVPQ